LPPPLLAPSSPRGAWRGTRAAGQVLQGAAQAWQRVASADAAASNPDAIARAAQSLRMAAQPMYLQLLLPISHLRGGAAARPSHPKVPRVHARPTPHMPPSPALAFCHLGECPICLPACRTTASPLHLSSSLRPTLLPIHPPPPPLVSPTRHPVPGWHEGGPAEVPGRRAGRGRAAEGLGRGPEVRQQPPACVPPGRQLPTAESIWCGGVLLRSCQHTTSSPPAAAACQAESGSPLPDTS